LTISWPKRVTSATRVSSGVRAQLRAAASARDNAASISAPLE
jgi:hypothetical protein